MWGHGPEKLKISPRPDRERARAPWRGCADPRNKTAASPGAPSAFINRSWKSREEEAGWKRGPSGESGRDNKDLEAGQFGSVMSMGPGLMMGSGHTEALFLSCRYSDTLDLVNATSKTSSLVECVFEGKRCNMVERKTGMIKWSFLWGCVTQHGSSPLFSAHRLDVISFYTSGVQACV